MRVLVADDAVAYRAIITKILGQVPGVEVVGVAANGRIALQKAEQLRPDLMTLDVEMPEIDGLEVLRRLQSMGLNVGVIILSSFNKDVAQSTLEALSLGAFDFVVKPRGDDPQTNAAKLRNELAFKIEAFRKAREIRNILHERKTPAVAVHGAAKGSARPAQDFGKPWKANVVTIGISTGGPPALTQLLPRLPADLAVPVLIVQHMPAMFTRSLADDLDRRCAVRVCEAADGQLITPGWVYIAPGGKQMKVESGEPLPVIRITNDPPENSCQPSVDYLFRSVAEVYGRNTLGIIMTGMGNDGSAGCQLLSRHGATLLAQDEASCIVYGMPREPIEQGIAKAVPLDGMADEIMRLMKRAGVATCK